MQPHLARLELALRKEGFFSAFQFRKKDQDSLLGVIYKFYSKKFLKSGLMKILSDDEMKINEVREISEIKKRYQIDHPHIL